MAKTMKMETMAGMRMCEYPGECMGKEKSKDMPKKMEKHEGMKGKMPMKKGGK